VSVLAKNFNAATHLSEGAYIGMGNDPFADSWIAFRRPRRSRSDDLNSSPPVLLCTQSKRLETSHNVSADKFNAEKFKVENKLPDGTEFVFVMIGDFVGTNAEPDPHEFIITRQNMPLLYGRLAERRAIALRPALSSDSQTSSSRR